MFKRVIWIILDSVGIGEAPDADAFGDVGADTLGNIIKTRGYLRVPNLEKMGLFSTKGTTLPETGVIPVGAYGKARELSNGKDTTTGHWEMVGIHTKQAFPTYPAGFPEEIMEKFVKLTGSKGYLGNIVASGTQIINELGDEHRKTGYPIIYTSADSVFQIAAHEEVIPLDRLYEICVTARELLTGEHGVARVIARPFIREGDRYVRTANRRDFSLKPDEENLLVYLKEAGYRVTAVGKIEDIFGGVGIGDAVHTKSNIDGMEKTMDFMDTQREGLIFTNLVEFDSTWGHRRDVEGYAQGLETFDEGLGRLLARMNEEDLLIINADHGCDPTFRGTDHTREYIPVLAYHKQMKQGVNLGILDTFADIGATIADNFGVKKPRIGESFKDRL
ncbi:MAG: phosphopentomutase [Bacteroidales bacterium]|nr:phosphopentomutase [Clostridium sp.]MCM1203028.1 phosphopentomutase [Bacteroidales bacterium]